MYDPTRAVQRAMFADSDIYVSHGVQVHRFPGLGLAEYANHEEPRTSFCHAFHFTDMCEQVLGETLEMLLSYVIFIRLYFGSAEVA